MSRFLVVVPDAAPNWANDGVPLCSEDECPSYDGKRCRLLGFRPDNICEPAVAEMAHQLRAARLELSVI